MPREAYNPECLFPTVKLVGGCVVIWAAISCYSAGSIITLNGEITASDYVDILGNQVYQMVQMFPNSDAVFQGTVHSCTQPEVFSFGLRSMKMHFNIFPGQHDSQT
jgi:hypothetical protein